MIDNQRKVVQEKARRIRAGLSNFLCNYMLAGNVQLTNLANVDNSILRASDVIGDE
jgi:hypothetical protein